MLHHLQQHIPIVVDLIFQRATKALVVHVIKVILRQQRIHSLRRCGIREAGNTRRICQQRIVGPLNIVNEAALVSRVDDSPPCQSILYQRQVQVALHRRAHFAAFGVGYADFRTCLEFIQDRFLGDESDRSGLRTRTEQGALRTCQHFDSVHISDVDVNVSTDRLNGLLIKVQGNIR